MFSWLLEEKKRADVMVRVRSAAAQQRSGINRTEEQWDQQTEQRDNI